MVWNVGKRQDIWTVGLEGSPRPPLMFPTKEQAIVRGANLAAPHDELRIEQEKEEITPMADASTQNHAQAIQDVVGTFQNELTKLAQRSAQIQANTSRAFLRAHTAFDHAEYINEMVEEAAGGLTQFLGPPPNVLAIPKADRSKVEDAVIVS